MRNTLQPKNKFSLRKATTADATAIANVYLASRKAFVSFAPLIHSDESILRSTAISSVRGITKFLSPRFK